MPGMSFSDETVGLKAALTSLVAALELSDPYTRGHSERVGMLSTAVGLEIGLEPHELEILQDAGALHDIGKIGIRKDLLNKPGRFTPEEFEEMKLHTIFGENILRPLGNQSLLDIALLHHERLDGKGYPHGVSDYPLLVRVLQVADVWDALTSDRPYRTAMPYSQARELMNSQVNQFGFDQAILEALLRLTRVIYPDTDCPSATDEVEQVVEEIVSSGLLDELAKLSR
jgi:putative two-component system response regulator